MLLRKSIFSFVLLVATIAATPSANEANADDAYCFKKNRTVNIYLMPRQNAVDDEIKRYQQTLESVFEGTSDGDEISLFGANGKGVVKLFSGCKPACPSGSFFNDWLGLGDCDPTRARAEFRSFQSSYIRSAMKQMSASHDGVSDVLKGLSAIQIHMQNGPEIDETWIVSSMANEANADLRAFNSWFVNMVQTETLPSTLPDATFTGLALNADLVNFWNDVFSLRGQEFSYR